MLLLLVAVGCLALGALHWYLARRGPAWPGAVVPVCWAVGVGVLVVPGAAPTTSTYLAIASGSFVLLQMWGEGRVARTSRRPAPDAV